MKHSKDPFYDSRPWLERRYEVLKRSRGRCEACGAGPSEHNPLHVDHIKPRSTHKHLELVLGNLQVLCSKCNLGKSDKDSTDWRFVTRVNEKRLAEISVLTDEQRKTRLELLDRAIKGSTEAEREAAKAMFVMIEQYERDAFEEKEK